MFQMEQKVCKGKKNVPLSRKEAHKDKIGAKFNLLWQISSVWLI